MRSIPLLASAGAVLFAAYSVALLLGVDSPLVTHWTFLTLVAVPSVAVVVRAVRNREQRVAWSLPGLGLSVWTLGWIWQAVGDLAAALGPGFHGVAASV